MVGRTRGRIAAHPILPCGLHLAGGDRRHRLSEQGVIYDLLFNASAEDADHHRRRSQTPGRADRRDFRAAYMGSALTHHPHVHMIVRAAVFPWTSERAVCSRASSCTCARSRGCPAGCFWKRLVAAHAAGRLQFFARTPNSADRVAFAKYLAPSARRMGGTANVLSAARRRAGLSVALHPPRRHLRQPPAACDGASVAFNTRITGAKGRARQKS